MLAPAKYHVVMNARSGTAMKMGRDTIEKLFQDSPLDVEELHIIAPDKIAERLTRLNANNETVLLAGGDGTIAKSLPCFLEQKRHFGVLPMGTMNLLAQDLGIPADLSGAIHAYANGHDVMNIDVGMVNGQAFLCCAAIGTIPEASQFRERKRGQGDLEVFPALTRFVLRQMNPSKQRRLQISIDHGQVKKLKTAALVISNNEYAEQGRLTQQNLRRDNLRQGAFGIYSAAPHTLWDKIRLLLLLTKGDWRKDPVMHEWTGKNLVVSSHRQKELLSLDGEVMSLELPLKFEILPGALPVLIPKREEKTHERSGHEHHRYAEAYS